MDGWWRKNPFFVRYMKREFTAFIVAGYAIVLLVGLISLANGEASYQGWRNAMSSPLSIALHAVALVVMIYHTWTWFEIMPKTMPPMYSGGKRVEGAVITWTGVVVAIVVTIVLFGIFWSAKP
jgi:fumarate reductase subunit C